jgi:phosphoketolase
MEDKLIERKQLIDKQREVRPEIRNWEWSATNAGKPA